MTQTKWTSVPGPESILRRELPNGIVGLAYENPTSPSVVIEGRLYVNGLSVPREQAGLAALTRELLCRGTAQRSFGEINEAIEAVGASLQFDGDWHSTSFSGRCLAEDLPLLLDILADCLRHPTFPADQVEKARGEFLTSIEQRASDTRRMAMLSLYETLYAGHPLAISGLGYEDSMRALTRDDLVRFYEARYQPQGMTFSIVGAVRKEEALAAVERVLGDWRPAARPDRAFPDVQRPTEIRRAETQIADKSQADLVFGWVGLERAHPDYMTARLANSVLGVFGIMGRIGHSVREQQGLAYYAYSHLVASFCPGPWMAVAGVNPRNIEKAAESILAEVRRLREELVPAGELADNKSYLTGSMPLTLETNGGIAGTLEAMEAHQLGLDYLQRYPEMIAAIGAEDIRRVAQTYLLPEAYTLAIARPK